MLEVAVAIEAAQRSPVAAQPLASTVLGASLDAGSVRSDETTEISIEWVEETDRTAAPIGSVPSATAENDDHPDEMTTAVKKGAIDMALAAMVFDQWFAKFVIGTGKYTVQLAASETGSAKLSLVPKVAGQARIDAGWVNVAKRVAEIRTFDCVAALYAHYFGSPPSFDRAQYDTFVARTAEVLKAIGVGSYSLVAAPAELLERAPPPPPSRRR